MGMAGHAEFVRSDMTVFAHVHPARLRFHGRARSRSSRIERRTVGDAGRNVARMVMPDASANECPAQCRPEVSFPYGFPQPGDYRIFVQLKRERKIQTAVFDAHVQ